MTKESEENKKSSLKIVFVFFAIVIIIISLIFLFTSKNRNVFNTTEMIEKKYQIQLQQKSLGITYCTIIIHY